LNTEQLGVRIEPTLSPIYISSCAANVHCGYITLSIELFALIKLMLEAAAPS